MFSSSPSLCPWLPEATLRQPADGEDNAQADGLNTLRIVAVCDKKEGKKVFLLGTSGNGRQDGGVSLRVAVHGRDSVPGDAQLHREGALHERREECRHHIRGRQQWYLTTGRLVPQQFLKTINAPVPVVYTGCEGYCRPFFKMVSCINRLSDHDKIFTVYRYPLLHLLLSSGVHLPARLKGPRQENQRADIVKIIRAV
jgi:hypothetical protein